MESRSVGYFFKSMFIDGFLYCGRKHSTIKLCMGCFTERKIYDLIKDKEL